MYRLLVLEHSATRQHKLIPAQTPAELDLQLRNARAGEFHVLRVLEPNDPIAALYELAPELFGWEFIR